MIRKSLTLVPVGPVTNRSPSASKKAALNRSPRAPRRRRAGARERRPVEKGAGRRRWRRRSRRVSAARPWMSARPARRSAAARRIFAVAAAAARRRSPSRSARRRRSGRCPARPLQGELGMGAADVARLAVAFAEQDRPIAEPCRFGRRRGDRVGRRGDDAESREPAPSGVSDQPRSGAAMPYRARIACASATVVGSATVGPEPISSGRSPATSEMASVSRRAGAAARARRPPLIRDRWRRTLLISPIGAPERSRALGDRLLFREVQPVARQAGQSGGAAAEQHQDQIVRARFPGQREQPLAPPRRWPASGTGWPAWTSSTRSSAGGRCRAAPRRGRSSRPG